MYARIRVARGGRPRQGRARGGRNAGQELRKRGRNSWPVRRTERETVRPGSVVQGTGPAQLGGDSRVRISLREARCRKRSMSRRPVMLRLLHAAAELFDLSAHFLQLLLERGLAAGGRFRQGPRDEVENGPLAGGRLQRAEKTVHVAACLLRKLVELLFAD